MSEAVEISVYMSVDEFLAWNPGGEGMWQLVDGVPQAMAPPSTIHGAILNRLAQVIGSHLDAQNSPCVAIIEPGVVSHINASHNLRVPDLAVTCTELEVRQSTLTDPVLIAEILSPSNQAETWNNVQAYATIASVREIVVLRSVFVGADIMRRHSDGTWPKEPEQIRTDDLVLDSIGMRTPLMDLYRRTPLWRPPGA
ncbi:MAG TPA: Uma2 family endonuclease [Acetobacteraceae bacterium]